MLIHIPNEDQEVLKPGTGASIWSPKHMAGTHWLEPRPCFSVRISMKLELGARAKYQTQKPWWGTHRSPAGKMPAPFLFLVYVTWCYLPNVADDFWISQISHSAWFSGQMRGYNLDMGSLNFNINCFPAIWHPHFLNNLKHETSDNAHLEERDSIMILS